MTFDDAFARVFVNEGELSLKREDRGNWTSGIVGQGELRGTKYGISAMSYPTIDIAALTVDGAKAIYRRDFWDRVHADTLPDGVAFQLFDFAINSGIETAVRYLQRAIGAADDGDWGPVSQAKADAMSESDMIMRLVAERLRFWAKLSNWPTYGRGYALRAARDLDYGAEDS